MTNQDTTPIKLKENDKMYHFLELLHFEQNDDLIGIDLQMLQPLLVVATS